MYSYHIQYYRLPDIDNDDKYTQFQMDLILFASLLNSHGLSAELHHPRKDHKQLLHRPTTLTEDSMVY